VKKVAANDDVTTVIAKQAKGKKITDSEPVKPQNISEDTFSSSSTSPKAVFKIRGGGKKKSDEQVPEPLSSELDGIIRRDAQMRAHATVGAAAGVTVTAAAAAVAPEGT
jgi:hypothetical protein